LRVALATNIFSRRLTRPPEEKVFFFFFNLSFLLSSCSRGVPLGIKGGRRYAHPVVLPLFLYYLPSDLANEVRPPKELKGLPPSSHLVSMLTGSPLMIGFRVFLWSRRAPPDELATLNFFFFRFLDPPPLRVSPTQFFYRPPQSHGFFHPPNTEFSQIFYHLEASFFTHLLVC